MINNQFYRFFIANKLLSGSKRIKGSRQLSNPLRSVEVWTVECVPLRLAACIFSYHLRLRYLICLSYPGIYVYRQRRGISQRKELCLANETLIVQSCKPTNCWHRSFISVGDRYKNAIESLPENWTNCVIIALSFHRFSFISNPYWRKMTWNVYGTIDTLINSWNRSIVWI